MYLIPFLNLLFKNENYGVIYCVLLALGNKQKMTKVNIALEKQKNGLIFITVQKQIFIN